MEQVVHLPTANALEIDLPELHQAFTDPRADYVGTFVFVDQNGSTQMKTDQTGSKWKSQLAWFYVRVTEIAQEVCPLAHTKYLGDGILITVDDKYAVEAINMAIKIDEAISAASQPRNDHSTADIDFNVSIGIATGDVVRFRAPDGGVDHVGLPVDKARRLCDTASPKAIFIDDTTRDAANMNRVESRIGFALNRRGAQYRGDRQLTPAKGLHEPIGYYEILWEQQLFGVRSAVVTESTAAAVVDPSPTRPGAEPLRHQPQPKTATTAKQERCVGRVKVWYQDRGFGFVTGPSGEEFYFNRKLMVFPDEDARKLAKNVELAFVALPSSTEKNRRAGGVLLVGEYADGVLTALPTSKPYGWITVKDEEGNRHPVYMALTVQTRKFAKGTELSFKVSASPHGAAAQDVELVSDDDDQPAANIA